MKREFVTVPGENGKLFEKTLEILTTSGILEVSDDEILEIIDENQASVLSKLLMVRGPGEHTNHELFSRISTTSRWRSTVFRRIVRLSQIFRK